MHLSLQLHAKLGASWNPASALGELLPPPLPQSQPRHTEQEKGLETDAGKGSRAPSLPPTLSSLSFAKLIPWESDQEVV